MKKNNDYYIMCVLIGIGIGSVFEVDPVTRVSIGSGMGVFIGGLIEHSNNEKAVWYLQSQLNYKRLYSKNTFKDIY